MLLADDNAQFAARIRELLEPTCEIVGVVCSGEELERAVDTLTPTVVITDIAMPGVGGLVAARNIRARKPELPVILLTVIDAKLMIKLALSSGALGYVVKEDAGEELTQAVEAALAGKSYVSSQGRRSLSQGT
ncbi:MAG TPA: response regulator transcription factor [Gemmatimonadales bacterium]|nr:response regulator transcription factor [Gemmatimonadales bacterium]